MKQAKKALIVVVALAIVLPMAALMVPVPDPLPAVSSAKEFRSAMAGTVLFAWLHIGAAILFLNGLKGFKEQLRHAYAAICLALVVTGIALIQIPAFIAFDLFESGWANAGLLPLPYVLSTFMLFFGVRLFAVALADKSVWIRTSTIVPVMAVLAGAGFLIISSFRPVGVALEAAIGIWNVSFILITLLLVLRIKRITGPAYTNALAWFYIALALSAIGYAASPLVLALGREQDSILALPIAAAGIAYVRAGYTFSKIGEY